MGKNPETNSPRPAPLASRPQRADGALIIFAKAPVPGQVKTRLCPPLTPDEAATLHGSFVLDTLERTKLAVSKLRLPLDRFLACAPAASHVFFKIMEERHGVSLIDQAGEDLGMRMHQAFTQMFARGYRRVILVGTDVPSLPLAHYQQALAALATHGLVLGPAQDGGYYLIGLTRAVPELFSEIPWSTDQVFIQTRDKAERLHLKAACLPPWRDIDTIQDVQALIEESRQDMKQPKQQRVFSARTAVALDLIAKRLKTRHV